MSVLTLIIIAILIAFNTFGMNQIMLMYQDIKYIKATIKDAVKGVESSSGKKDAFTDQGNQAKETSKVDTNDEEKETKPSDNDNE